MLEDQLALSIYKIFGLKTFNCIYAKHISGSLHSRGDLSFLFDSPFPMEPKMCPWEAATWPHSSPNHWKHSTDKY